MRLEHPAPSRTPQLRKLWKEAFGDSDDFLDRFFQYGFDPKRCRCMVEADTVVSALYWFEGSCRGQRFAYLYAVATAASHRGRGLFTALLEDVKQLLTREGFHGILLVPETEGLCRMYQKLGFSPCTAVDCHKVSPAGKPAALQEISGETYMQLRRGFLPEGAFDPGREMLSFLACLYRFYRGEGWLAAGQTYEGKLVCQEFLGDGRAMGGLVRALGAAAGEFRTPGRERPLAWFLPLREDCGGPAYFAFAMD